MKKTLLIACALVLVCALSITGTLAYLQTSSNSVSNTFVAQGGGKLLDDDPSTEGTTEGTFTITEAPIKPDGSGNYVEDTEGSSTDSGLSYEILPGSTLFKKAEINITGKTTVPAYLYVEVKDELTTGLYTYTVDAANWTDLNMLGNEGGKLYVYAGGVINANDTEKFKAYENINILDDNTITVSSTATESDLEDVTEDKLSFYGYLAQASAGTDAATAYTACFSAD